MDPHFHNRINYKGPIEDILKRVCEEFNLGEFKSYQLIPFGYEDFNVVINTSKNIFFVKIFASYRSDDECKQYVHVMNLVRKNGIHYPFLYKSSRGENYCVIKIGKAKIRLVVQEFIDGKNFIQLQEKPTKKEKELIVRQASIISKLEFKPKPVYDSWAIVNFAKEFEKRGKLLPLNLKEKAEEALREFTEIDIDKLPHCFVNGDIIRSNIMRDKNGKIWIIDFAVSNYYPRIIELASLICFNFFDPERPKSLQENLDFVLKTYQKFIPLKKEELNALPMFMKASFAMYLMMTNYEKVANGNNSAENEHWLKIGTTGLQII